MYAIWYPTYTLTFDINGGTGTAPDGITVRFDTMTTLPPGSGFYRSGYVFGGWNTADDGTGTHYDTGDWYTVTDNATLYAKWDEPITDVPGATLAAKLAWLQSNAVSGVDYTVEAGDAESVGANNSLSYSGRTSIGITLKGSGAGGSVFLSSNGLMFTVGSGVTLKLVNITLYGRNNNDEVIRVLADGTLIMEEGSTVTGNRNPNPTGGGVYVAANGTFTMNGGTISGNTASAVGAYLNNNPRSCGGGVYVVGTFTMNGGTISGNTSSASSTALNTPYSYGGGVYVAANGVFTMSGGTISGNTSSSTPSGVSGAFNAYSYGGGVHVDENGRFTMNGGTISGNTSIKVENSYTTSAGGGVSVTGFFVKNGGTIYGYDENDAVNSNVVKRAGTVVDGNGHAVYGYNSGGFTKYKDGAAGPGVNLMYNAGAFSGAWDN
jgi:uncharacterized repeat protein (TIGR02543 family)